MSCSDFGGPVMLPCVQHHGDFGAKPMQVVECVGSHRDAVDDADRVGPEIKPDVLMDLGAEAGKCLGPV
jgi:hypothetical protein